ncbi:PepSY-like domain-containing protein [uncultured Fluviicola sp.]|uniref:PepSY-like domain-containing protein n=1 Tax=uncultured Fluviicola sp. TaxID=463303 RepID=UPI0025DE9977|nr:PepSY-like domain-containing protein [uncultured Fluviicola sp.]
MKGLKLIVLTFLPIAFGACASTIDPQEIPSVVINAVVTKYPDAKDLDWEVKNGIYEAEFDLGKDDYEVWVNAKGTILKIEQEIKNTELPAVILSKLKTDYKDFKPDDAKRIEIGKAVYYEIELDGTFGDQKVVYSASGEKQDPNVLMKI